MGVPKIEIENYKNQKLPSPAPSTSSPHLWGRKKVGGILRRGVVSILLLSIALLFLEAIFWITVWASPVGPTIGRQGMVATGHPLATAASLEVLKKGGNAVDAAVVAAFTLAVVEPHASGLGGKSFIMIRKAKTGKVISIDASTVAPGLATLNRYSGDKTGRLEGWKSSAVPGMLAGLSLALERHGTISLSEALEPAIHYAREGFPVDPFLAQAIRMRFKLISRNPATAAIFAPHGRPLREGERLVQKDLAVSLRKIAQKGPSVFYQGELADAIEAGMVNGGGLVRKSDLAHYKVLEREVLSGSYRDYEIYTHGPPTAGLTLLEVLNILEGYDLGRAGFRSARAISLVAQAMKQAYADREVYIGDPDFVRVPVDRLVSKEYAREVRAKIDQFLKTGLTSFPLKRLSFTDPPWHESTTHISVVDKEGNLVAVTQTLYSFFGSGVVIPGTGILMNNDMANFDITRGGPNVLEPGKRPRNSFAPVIVLKDGTPFLVMGSPGAKRIVAAMAQTLVNAIDHGMNIQKAISAPRIFAYYGRELEVELPLEPSVRLELVRMGYLVREKKDLDFRLGGVQAVLVDRKTGFYYGGADPRRYGSAAGY